MRGEDEEVERSVSPVKMATKRITLILHHKGFLGRQEGVLRYIGGEMCVWEGLDIDTINKFIVETLCKEHYYRRFERIYWLKPGRHLEVGLRELEKDAHVVNMCNAVRKNEGEIEIFFIHPIEQTPPVCRPSCPPVGSPLHTPMSSPIQMMSDDSDEDSAYIPSPVVSEDDDMDDSVVKKKRGFKSKTTPVKRKIRATSNDKGKGVVVDASEEDEIFVEEEIDVGSNVGNGEEDDISKEEVDVGGLFPKSAFRPKLNTMRPPPVGSIVPPQATPPDSMNNSSTQQLPGQPSQGTINAASQGTREMLMKFIPTPRGPSTKPK
ncbi:hypothetical protein SESBI_30325 [Sesbania bispinosa]|nr:hypothetical protein SESBI_30325 [Sesbania bispinosa]